MEQNKFKEVMAMLGESYGKQITPALAKLYWATLKDLTDEQFEHSVFCHLNDNDKCQYWPQPGTLRAYVQGTTKQKQVSVESKAIEAWEYIHKQIQRIGTYGNLEMEDKLALKAIAYMGGWVSINQMMESEVQWRRKEFIDAYKTLHGSLDLPEYLTGIGRESNESLEVRKTLDLIGEKVKELNENNVMGKG